MGIVARLDSFRAGFQSIFTRQNEPKAAQGVTIKGPRVERVSTYNRHDVQRTEGDTQKFPLSPQ